MRNYKKREIPEEITGERERTIRERDVRERAVRERTMRERAVREVDVRGVRVKLSQATRYKYELTG